MLDGVHTFGLRANSSSAPFDQWGLTVGAAETLTIDSIKGLVSGKEIPEGTSTAETLFAMSGKARANSTCYLRIDGVRQPGLIGVDGNGDWVCNTATQVPGRRSYEIEGNYDSGPVSTPPRTLTVIQALSVDTSVLHLNGVMVRGGHIRAHNVRDAPGNTATRLPSGGVSPYTYEAFPSHIAQVNAQGKVEGMHNGIATITIRDQSGSAVSYQVVVSNIYNVAIFHYVGMNYPLYLQALPNYNAISMTPQIQAALGCYNPPVFNWPPQPLPTQYLAWTGPANGNSAQGYNAQYGTFSYYSQTAEFPNNGIGFYLA